MKEVFVRLYEKDLIYRGERIINWCPHCMTSISNAEVVHTEQKSHFWHIRYPLVGRQENIWRWRPQDPKPFSAIPPLP